MAGTLSSWLGCEGIAALDERVFELSTYRGGYPISAELLLGNHETLSLGMATPLNLFAAVERCSTLAAVIGKLSDAYANGKCEVLNRNTQNYVRGTYKEWERLMDKPNKHQSRTDFRKQLFAFTKINGWCYVLPEYPAGFDDRPSALYILPPWMISVEALPQTYQSLVTGKVRRLWFEWGGYRTELDESKLILFKDTGTDIDRNTWLPKSRLIPLAKPIANIIAVEDAENNLVVKRGGIGFISGEAGKDQFGNASASAEDKKDLHDEFQRTRGLTGNRELIAISTAAMRWNPMAFNTKDLMLIEIDEAAAGKLCDGLGYSYYLLSNGKSGTFSNVSEAEKSLYQNTILPNAQALDEQLNEGLKTPDNNIEIRTDYSHIEALQESETEAAAARKTKNEAMMIEWEAGKLTLNQWAVALGDDKIQGEQFDMYKPQYDQWLREQGLMPELPAPGENQNSTSNGTTEENTGG